MLAGVSAAGYAILRLRPPRELAFLLIVQILATITGLMYLTATVLCEPNPAKTGDDSGLNKGGEDGAAAATGAGKAGEGTKLTPGQAMFNPEGSAYGATTAPASSAPAGMFSGGSLFPSGPK